MRHSPGRRGHDQTVFAVVDGRWWLVCWHSQGSSQLCLQGTVNRMLCQSWAQQARVLAPPILSSGALSSHARSPATQLERPCGEGVCWTCTAAWLGPAQTRAPTW